MAEDLEQLRYLLEKVYRERGFDFREYKETTLARRLIRRLRARGAATYADYARVLDRDPAECDRLFDDLTIHVTSFLRDEIAFTALEEVVLPGLLGKRTKTLRVWSAGCATGEEPYSIAMLLLESLGQDMGQWEVTILATDMNAKILDRARAGVFAPQEVEGIRPAWRARYFVLEGGRFRVQPALRQLVTFEVHNLATDPPYRATDLVVCRNVLIYFTYLRREGQYQDATMPGLLLLDINMPRKDGFAVLEEIKANPALQHLPVIMLTTSERDEDIVRSYSKGACSYVTKPVRFDEFRQVVKQFTLYWTLVSRIPAPR